MNRTKCRNCDLVNMGSETTCRRCGTQLGSKNIDSYLARSPREAAKKSSWLYTILFITLLGTGATYLFNGVERSFDEVKSADLNRVATQSKQQTNAQQPRGEFEKNQTQNYGNAIRNSSGLAESQKHVEETQKLMQPNAGKNTK